MSSPPRSVARLIVLGGTRSYGVAVFHVDAHSPRRDRYRYHPSTFGLMTDCHPVRGTRRRLKGQDRTDNERQCARAYDASSHSLLLRGHAA